jgi:hypothetical protein
MGNLLESLVWGAKNGQYCVIGGVSLQMVTMESKSLIGLMNRIQRATGVADSSTLTSRPSVVALGLYHPP